GPVLGVDLNFAMLRAARRFVKEGRVTYARRVTGLVYEERSLSIDASRAADADFWCADALALPFAPGTFGLTSSVNLIDCVTSPLEHLRAVSDVLRPGGAALVATPFDWAPSATPVEQWLGGHSRRSGPEVVRALAGSEQLPDLRVEAELDGLEWPVRLHERAEMRYRVALFVLRKLTSSA
ncbi:MAG: class I SAM-dependent methyltransferase, partial [Planctomycetota bacterium]